MTVLGKYNIDFIRSGKFAPVSLLQPFLNVGNLPLLLPHIAFQRLDGEKALATASGFSVAAAGIPTIMELSLMPVTRYWLPVEDGFEKQLIERLVVDGRSFVKGLRYDLGAGSALASATLTDCEGSAPLLFVVHAGIEDSERYLQVCEPSVPVWMWNASGEAMPALPPRRQHHPRAAEFAVECR